MSNLKHNVIKQVQRGKFAEAVAMAQAEFDSNPTSPEANHVLAYAFERSKDLESAIKAATKAVELAPEEPSLRFHRGWLLLKVDDALEALEEMRRAIAQEKELGVGYYTETASFLAAEALCRLRRYSESLDICSSVRPDFSIYLGKHLSKDELVRNCERALMHSTRLAT